MTFRRACETGNLEWLKEAVEERRIDHNPFASYDEKRMLPQEICASLGHLHILKWMHEEPRVNVNLLFDDCNTFRWAATKGHLDIIKWMHKTFRKDLDPTANDNEAAAFALINGHLDVVNFLLEAYPGQIRLYGNLDSNLPKIIREIVDYSRTDLLEWMMYTSPQLFDLDDFMHTVDLLEERHPKLFERDDCSESKKLYALIRICRECHRSGLDLEFIRQNPIEIPDTAVSKSKRSVKL